jgi:hypothetical protein
MRENAGKLDRETEFPVAEFDELRAIGALSAVVPERLVGWPLGSDRRGHWTCSSFFASSGAGISQRVAFSKAT